MPSSKAQEPDWARARLEDDLVRNEEGKSAEGGSSSSRQGSHTSSVRRRRGASRTLVFFRFMLCLTILLAVVVAAVNCYIIYKNWNSGVRAVALRVYGIFFCIIVIMSELESRGFMKHFGFLGNWIARGGFYIFVGLITWDQGGGKSAYDDVEDVVAFMMMGVGGLYIIMGMACMRTVKEAELQDEMDSQFDG